MRKPYLITPERPFINLLLFSEPGVGKTTFAAQAQDHPHMKNVLFANIEGGTISIAYRQDIHAVDVKSVDDLTDMFWDIKRRKYSSVNTVVIDNLSELQRVNLEQIVAEAMTKQKGKTKRESPDDIWQEDYGVSTLQMERIIRWFRNLEINLILTAHAKYVYPKTGRNKDTTQVDPIVVLPTMTQALCKSVMGLVDFVWYMGYDAEEDERYLITQPDGVIAAKTRGPRFAKAIGQYRPLSKEFGLPQIYDMLDKSESAKPRRRRVKKKATKRTKA